MASKEEYVSAPPPAYTTAQPQQASEVPMQAEHANHEPTSERIEPSHPVAPQADVPEKHRPRMVTPLENLGTEPADVDCPYCQQTVRTNVNQEPSSTAWILGIVIGLFCICLACVPCCMSDLKDTDHYCTKCGRKLTHKHHDAPIVVCPNGANPSAAVPSKYSSAQAPQPGQSAAVKQ